MNCICKTCKTEYVSKLKTSYCSPDCYKFYENTVRRLPKDIVSDAQTLSTDEDYKEFIKRYFFMKTGKLSYQLLASPILPKFLGIDPLKYANAHNNEESINARVLLWLYDVNISFCKTCGKKPAVDVKNGIPSYRKYCSEECYTASMRKGGSARVVLDKAIKTKYGVDNVFSVKAILRKAQDNNIKTCMEKYGVPHVLQNSSMYRHITRDLNNQSKPEKDISEWLDSLGIKHKTSDYSLLANHVFEDGGTRRQIDIYCPDHNLAIEFNGLYWHSELHKYKNYHVEKTHACESQGVQLVQIWEDEWLLKPDVVKGLLMAKLGIVKPTTYARKCRVEEGKATDIQDFLRLHHIQGPVSSASHYLLLKDGSGTLQAVMTFSRRLVKSKRCYELTRFAANGCHGAFSKLLKYFMKTINTEGVEVFSFGDRCVVNRNSNVYINNGFVEQEIQEPDYKYHKPGTLMREHKFGFRKEKFLSMGYDIEGKTESDLASEAGLVRIWGCGLIRYKLSADYFY